MTLPGAASVIEDHMLADGCPFKISAQHEFVSQQRQIVNTEIIFFY